MAEKGKPNILMIMADQLVPMMLGAYGNKEAKTPNIDCLAKEGVIFDNAYTSCPICTAARMSLLTGRYASETKCHDNGSILASDEPTHNHYLTIAGYDTVLSGKLHAIGPDQLHGYAHRLTTDIYPADFTLMVKRKDRKALQSRYSNPIAADYLAKGTGVRQWSMQLDYDEETLFRAKEYLRCKCTEGSESLQRPHGKRDDRPFFLHVSFNHPHEPFHSLKKYWDLYEGVTIPIPKYPENLEKHYTSMDRSVNIWHGCKAVDVKTPEGLRNLYRSYLASVSYLDDKVGEILETLKHCGLADDTVIIFLSDHGEMLGHRGMIQKRSFYEYSSRISLIFRFPEKFLSGKAGVICRDAVSIVDICPTILEMAGITDYIPMDGRSLLPQLKGESDPNRYVFCENHSEGVDTTCFMVRKGKYKYTYMHHGETQLFDMKADPEEWNNLSGNKEYREVENELKDLILNRFDPERIDKELDLNVKKRWLIKKAFEKGKAPRWSFQPFFDAEKQYRRGW